MRKKYVIINMKKYFSLKNFASYKGKYKKLFCLCLKSSLSTNFLKTIFEMYFLLEQFF